MRIVLVTTFLLLAWCAPARAMYVNPGGTGQALIFPYFSAQSKDGNPYNTYISIANASGFEKALRVRVREGRNGREVAGFNLFLRQGDMWTGAVVPEAAGAALLTADESCVSAGFRTEGGTAPTYSFSPASYIGPNADLFGNDVERLREGYVEVLEMAAFENNLDTCPNRLAGTWTRPALTPTGGLSGTLTVINVLDGTDFTVNAVALEDVAGGPFYRVASDPYPDFDVVEINRTSAFVQGGNLYRTTWGTGVGALDAVLMHSSVDNEVVLDSGTNSSTDWVVTLPTKRFHTRSVPPTGPFAQGLIDNRDVPVNLTYATREGQTWNIVDGCGFLCPGGNLEADIRLRWASSVLSFRTAPGAGAPVVSTALASRNAWNIPTPQQSQNGSAQVRFGGFPGTPQLAFTGFTTDNDTGITVSQNFRMRGLPVVGFMARTFRNGTLTCTGTSCQGNYGGSFEHKYSRVLEP